LHKASPALLVLDLQELFSSAAGPFENSAAEELITHVNAFASDCERMSLPIICSRYVFRDDLSDAGLLANNALVKQGYFCESSPWMKLDKRLLLPDTTISLQRNRPGAFWNDNLTQTLQKNKIDTLLLCGLSVNNAISTTARQAFARDIPAFVIKECTGAAPWETEIESYFETLHTWTAEVITKEDIKRRLNEALQP
jgi:nicotinamidase-related amidase